MGLKGLMDAIAAAEHDNPKWSKYNDDATTKKSLIRMMDNRYGKMVADSNSYGRTKQLDARRQQEAINLYNRVQSNKGIIAALRNAMSREASSHERKLLRSRIYNISQTNGSTAAVAQALSTLRGPVFPMSDILDVARSRPDFPAEFSNPELLADLAEDEARAARAEKVWQKVLDSSYDRSPQVDKRIAKIRELRRARAALRRAHTAIRGIKPAAAVAATGLAGYLGYRQLSSPDAQAPSEQLNVPSVAASAAAPSKPTSNLNTRLLGAAGGALGGAGLGALTNYIATGGILPGALTGAGVGGAAGAFTPELASLLGLKQ